MAGLLTKGITLGYKKGSSESTYTLIANLQAAPALGGTPERVDVTTLEDANRKYIQGVKEYEELAFTFLYDNTTETSNYRVVRGLEEEGGVVDWEVTFPDTTKFHFSGEVATSINEAEVNAAITFTANITLNSDIEVVNPTA